jgi:hypothetical protein
MAIFGSKKERKEEPKVQEVPDELPPLYEQDISPPRPQPKTEPVKETAKPAETVQLPRLEPEEVVPAPVEMKPVYVEEHEPIQEAATGKPRKLIDHINLIDKLKEQLAATEKEIARLSEMLGEKKRLSEELRGDLAREIELVKSELGLAGGYQAVSVIKKKTSKSAPAPKSAGIRVQGKPVLAPDKYFYFVDGSRATSIAELLQRLIEVPDEVFGHHCSSQRNDFFLWIEGVFDDKELARRIESVTSRREMVRALSDYING